MTETKAVKMDKTEEYYYKELTDYGFVRVKYDLEIRDHFNMQCSKCNRKVHGLHVGMPHRRCVGYVHGIHSRGPGIWLAYSPSEPIKPNAPKPIELQKD